jgi:hypothetical protein
MGQEIEDVFPLSRSGEILLSSVYIETEAAIQRKTVWGEARKTIC